MSFKPLCGLFSHPKLLPLRYLNNLTVELKLVNNAEDPIIHDFPQYANIEVADVGLQWSMSDCRLLASIVTLDSGLENSYAEYLLSGKTIPIPMTTYISQSQSLVQGDQENVNITRSLTRLKTLFVTLW